MTNNQKIALSVAALVLTAGILTYYTLGWGGEPQHSVSDDPITWQSLSSDVSTQAPKAAGARSHNGKDDLYPVYQYRCETGGETYEVYIDYARYGGYLSAERAWVEGEWQPAPPKCPEHPDEGLTFMGGL